MVKQLVQWTVIGVCGSGLLMPVVCVAQSNTTSSDVLEEIVVTARKRDESLHDVPVAVNAFGAAEIQSAGIERPQDFIALTPNVTMVQTQNQGTSFITVRGISQARNSEPSVAVLIDGVLLANPSQFNQELFDIEHIEVLKGPQGALYGRNAIGGAIIIRTQEPGDELGGKLQVGYDSGPGFKVRGSVGGPLNADKTLKDQSGRLKLIWEPSDTFKADFRTYFSQVNTQALYFNITESVNDTSLPVRVNNPGEDNRRLRGASAKLDFDTGIGTLTSISAYDHIDELLTGDQFNFLPVDESVLFLFTGADQVQHQWLDVDAFSQELRLASKTDGPVRWIVGAYYIVTDRFISTGNIFDNRSGLVPRIERTPHTFYLLGGDQFTFL